MPVQIPMPGLAVNSLVDVIVAKLGEPGEPNIRKFNLADLNSQIDEAVKALGEHSVMGLARVDLTGAHLTIVGKVPVKVPGQLNWTIWSDKPWNGPFDAGVGVRWMYDW